MTFGTTLVCMYVYIYIYTYTHTHTHLYEEAYVYDKCHTDLERGEVVLAQKFNQEYHSNVNDWFMVKFVKLVRKLLASNGLAIIAFRKILHKTEMLRISWANNNEERRLRLQRRWGRTVFTDTYNLTICNKFLPVTKPVAIKMTVVDGKWRNCLYMDLQLPLLMWLLLQEWICAVCKFFSVGLRTGNSILTHLFYYDCRPVRNRTYIFNTSQLTL